jgi:hypothetical protein
MRRALLAMAVLAPLIGIGSAPAEAFCCDGWGYSPYYLYYPRTNCYVPQPHYRPYCDRGRSCQRARYCRRSHRDWRKSFHFH